MIIEILRNLFAGSESASGREVIASGVKRSGNEIEVITPITVEKRYEDDVKRLKNHIGEDKFKPGLKIEVGLQELLSIVPRKRNRSDAYVGLINYLKGEMCIEMKIKTKKKKKL